MSVRRLAEDAIQPGGFKFNPANGKWAKETIKKYPKGREASAVIPLLMRAQEQDGWVTKAAIEHMAELLDMPYIRVLEVATFYTQFQLAPVGKKAHVQVCGTTPCMLRGAGDLIQLCKKKINEKPFETNADGTLSWEEVECQGACVNAPMVMIFKDTYEDLTPERLEEIIDAFEAGKGDSITPGPQIDRIFSAPEGGPVTLLEDPVAKKNTRVPKAKGAGTKATKTPSPTKKARPPRSGTKGKPQPAGIAKMGGQPSTDAGNVKKKLTSEEGAKVSNAAKKAPAKQASASLNDKNRPPQMKKPSGSGDDLKLISGVGPKLEGVLHGLGIYTFEQISKWKKAERDWVDGYLKFKGRIDRDDWVKQAKALAKGGEAEYIKVFGKKPR